ncbi:tetratricopeptide repeat protein [Leptotrichia sp. oral taxon 879]|uniref:Tetratricopeptide repeat protein n=1 Tax=Leptotrichia mesophila TaxID=3239303 RepID=A0AB39VBK7_9FUSO|nr:tetratricopeptide repeat protein [Leptotrichia sp. oral taxon 879]ERK53639.1 tetratricopeptide repeat protein [Leptotrichia sp. oral taxon 879 str. F0557]
MTNKEKEIKEARIKELLVKREEYVNNGEIEKEIVALRELKVLFRRVYGDESNENIKVLTELGNALKYVGKFEESLRLLSKVENIVLKKYGENSLAFVTCSANLAEVYRIMKKYDKVEEKYSKAIKIYKKNNFKNGYVFSGICNNLGLFCEENGHYEDSIKWQQRSLEILENFQNNDVQKAIILSNMVKSYIKLDEKKLAKNMMEKSLEILSNEVGENSNLYLNIINNLANVYFESNSYKIALILLEKCEHICKIILGTENENYKNILEKISIVKKKIEKHKMEQYVWKDQIVKKIKN